jgi:hypothetical protein
MNDLTFETRIGTDHLVRLPDSPPVGARVRVTVEPLAAALPVVSLWQDP